MALDPRLLEILRCPISGQPLALADAAQLRILAHAGAQHALKRVDASPVTTPLQVALISADGVYVYRVDAGIPVLLESEAIQSPPGLMNTAMMS